MKRKRKETTSLDINEYKSVKKTVTLFLNTEKHHEGVTEKIPFVHLVAKSGGSIRNLWRNFLSWCFEVTNAHTPVLKIYEFPSHKKIRKFEQIESGGRYLVVGKEYTLGPPDHNRSDYPILLKKEREKYVEEHYKEEPKKSRISIPVLAQTVQTTGISSSLPPSHNSFPVSSQSSSNNPSNPSTSVAKSGGGPVHRGRPPLLKSATVSFIQTFTFDSRKKKRNVSDGEFLKQGDGKEKGLGYSSLRNVRPPEFSISLYLYSNINDEGKEMKVDLFVIFRKGGKDDKERFSFFKEKCRKLVNCMSPVSRILHIPSHKVIRRIKSIEANEKYLVIGKNEFLVLGIPEYIHKGYPKALCPLRIEFLQKERKENEMLNVIDFKEVNLLQIKEEEEERVKQIILAASKEEEGEKKNDKREEETKHGGDDDNDDNEEEKEQQQQQHPSLLNINIDQQNHSHRFEIKSPSTMGILSEYINIIQLRKKMIIRIKVYINAVRAHEGFDFLFNKDHYIHFVKGDGPGKTVEGEEAGLEQLYKDIHDALDKSGEIMYSPIFRLMKVPEHYIIKSPKEIQNGQKYLCIGREFFLYANGKPEHTNNDYPEVLVQDRIRYLNKRKKRINSSYIRITTPTTPTTPPTKIFPSLLLPSSPNNNNDNVLMENALSEEIEKEQSPSQSFNETRKKKRRRCVYC